MNLLWHMPILRRHTCGLSIRAMHLASLLREAGHGIVFAVDADKTDIREGSISGMPLLQMSPSKRRPMHWSLQASVRREAAAEMAERVGFNWDAVISCQPEFVAEYSALHGRPPVVFVCGSTTLHHDAANQARHACLATMRRIPYVIDRTLKRRNERRAFRAADAVVFDSRQTRELVILEYGVSPEKCHTIRGGVDKHRFRPPDPEARCAARGRLGIDESEFAISWTGRLSPEKNLSLLVRALPRCTRLPDHVLIVGEGPASRELIELCKASGLGDVVRFVGAQQDIRPYLHAADVFVFPSRSESFGMAAVEAMACGLPVVGLRPDGNIIRNANIELIDDGQCGLLVDGMDPIALAAAMDRLRIDVELRRRLGGAGRRWALRHFTWTRAGRRFGKLLSDVASLQTARTSLHTLESADLATAVETAS
ncbi:MAG: glycosyltransferase family 4 protein [Planctomycetota bacterium]